MTEPINSLLAVMAKLRDPKTGCPWDIKQNFKTIAPYTLEEASEVADAIERGNMADLCDELGDLLLQVVFHAQMASEQQLFDFDDVAAAITDKMVRRHPHVFGDKTYASEAEQKNDWEAIKQQERGNNSCGEQPSALDGITLGLPALLRAMKLGKRAATTGFDFPSLTAAREKLVEELAELDDELGVAELSANQQRIHEELGDVLFSVCNIARKTGIDAEASLRDANSRFEARFRTVEQQAQGFDLKQFSDDELEQHWQAAKQELEKRSH